MEEIIDNNGESSQEGETNDEYKDRKEVNHRNHKKCLDTRNKSRKENPDSLTFQLTIMKKLNSFEDDK